MKFQDASQAMRAALLQRFAVMQGGRAARCHACVERKIVFPDRRAVEGFVSEMIKLFGDTNMFVYQCTRSAAWHYTSEVQGGGGGASGDAAGGVRPDGR